MSMYYLNDSVRRLGNIAKTIEEDKKKEKSTLDFTTVRGNTLQAFIDYKSAVLEAIFLIAEPDPTLLTARTMMDLIESSLMKAKDFDEMKQAMASIISLFSEYDRYSYYELWNCKISARSNRNEFPTSFSYEYLKQLTEGFKGMTRPITVLNPYIGNCDSALVIKDVYCEPMNLYAVDVNQTLRNTEKQEFHRLIIGDLKGATISHDVFDVVLAAPPTSLDRKGKNYIEKIERDYLQRSLSYVRDGGVFAFAIPVTHLYKEMCQYLAKNLKDVQIRLLDKKIAFICGYRNMDKSRTVDRAAHLALRTLILNLDDEKYDCSKTPLKALTLPLAAMEVKMFRGSKIDESEFPKMYAESSATQSFLDSQKVEKLSENTKTPLLPFNVGQLGLILTSGCLDGVIDEGDGYYHVVKGRVVKKNDVSHDVSAERGRVDVTKVESNRVEINVFLADGTYKRLA